MHIGVKAQCYCIKVLPQFSLILRQCSRLSFHSDLSCNMYEFDMHRKFGNCSTFNLCIQNVFVSHQVCLSFDYNDQKSFQYNTNDIFYFFILFYGSDRGRVIIAFQEKDGFDVAFFMMYTQEWTYTEGKEDQVYISVLDSVQYFEPHGLRTQIYQKIIIGYLKYASDIG